MLQVGIFTSNELTADGDEYVSTKISPKGEEKVTPDGHLLGDREYRIHTFNLPGRGNRLYMMATECAKELNYRDSYLLFNKNKSLYKMIASQKDKETLIAAGLLPYSFRSRQIALVTARSMFRQFGARVIRNGKRVRDDYWEERAVEQGMTENDPVPNDKKHHPAHSSAGSSGYPSIGGGPSAANTMGHHQPVPAHQPSPYKTRNSTPGAAPILSHHTRHQASETAAIGSTGSGITSIGVTGSLSSIFIPGASITGSIDYPDPAYSSMRSHARLTKHKLGVELAHQALDSQHAVVKFNTYLGKQRRERAKTWGRFWGLRQEQFTKHITPDGIRELIRGYYENKIELIDQEEDALVAQMMQLVKIPPQGAFDVPPQQQALMPDPPLVAAKNQPPQESKPPMMAQPHHPGMPMVQAQPQPQVQPQMMPQQRMAPQPAPRGRPPLQKNIQQPQQQMYMPQQQPQPQPQQQQPQQWMQQNWRNPQFQGQYYNP
ncbi:hypothetical protein TRVA0_012S01640 [Trichomonascus vanleenenianus]|uniref:chromatin structure-remodeling complex subunit RSC7 n=1 Tax=Trichomonascus vanleenenianus TaxID=2268995 RepID=UPI003ECB0309